METTVKEIGTRADGKIGQVNMPTPTLDEAVAQFGDDIVAKLFIRSLHGDYERIAREALKGGKSEEEVQAMVDSYQPGTRQSGKPSHKKLLDIFVQLITAGNSELVLAANSVKDADGVDAAFAYLKEHGVAC